MIETEEQYDVNPICPHCKAEIKKVWTKRMAGFLGKRILYFCPHCRSILGVSHRKGFWMG